MYAALCAAVKSRDYSQVEKLLEDGVDPNLGEEDMKSHHPDYPLKIVIRQDNVKMFQLLLKYGMKWQIKEAHYSFSRWWESDWIALGKFVLG